MFTTMTLNGALGFGRMVAILFCLGVLETVLDTPTGFLFIQIFSDATKSNAGSTVITAMVLAHVLAYCIGVTATASGMVWSFAHDRGLPLSRFISKFEPRDAVPMVAVAIIAIISRLLDLIYICSYTPFNNVISLTITGIYGAYFLPSAFLLWHRIKGHLFDHGSQVSPSSSTPYGTAANDKPTLEGRRPSVAQPILMWGPWGVHGILGIIIDAYACVYMIFVVFWSVWPLQTPTN